MPPAGIEGRLVAMDAHARLSEVIARGAPGQSQMAQLLVARLEKNPNAGALEQAALLYDAYLNDPYLTRESGQRIERTGDEESASR